MTLGANWMGWQEDDWWRLDTLDAAALAADAADAANAASANDAEPTLSDGNGTADGLVVVVVVEEEDDEGEGEEEEDEEEQEGNEPDAANSVAAEDLHAPALCKSLDGDPIE